MHDGRVTAHSKGLGQGSEFVVRLPVAPGSVPALDRSSRGRSIRRMRNCLAGGSWSSTTSEATPKAWKFCSGPWAKKSYTAYDGPAALELARQHRPDVVLLDIGLPVMDGYEVARRCREEPGLRGMILVAMTGYGQDSDRRRSQEAGFDAHLVKPVNLQDLVLLLTQTGSFPPVP